MADGFTIKQIASAVGVTEMTVLRQSRGWRGVKRPKGKGLMYPLEVLPEKIQQKLLSKYKEQNGSPEPDSGDRTGNSSDSCPDHNPSPVPVLVEHTELVGAEIAPMIPAQGNEERVSKPQREPRAVGRPKGAKGDAKIDAWVEIFKARKAWCTAHGIAKQVNCDDAFSEAYLRHEIDLRDRHSH
jgi:hypothetical protein